MRELDLIRWIRRRWKFDPRAVPVGPGDDCAVVRCGGEKLLVTTDQVLDGVHFILARDGPAAAGRKAMARNLSDIAAMAGRPLAAVVCAALPKGLSAADCKAIYSGMRRLGERFGCPVVGGDIGAWDGALAIGVTVLGTPGPRGAVLRSGAKPGDAVCVTGSLGGAWQARRDLRFTPRIAEAQRLAAACDLHAMIDISDGLATDLGHLAEESGVGAEVVAADIPVHRGAKGIEAALRDGEDYELIFTLPAGQAARLPRLRLGARPGVKVTRIGTIVRGGGLTLVHPDGRREKIKAKGWEHRT
jgi:thiamine-monophosphate kinase